MTRSHFDILTETDADKREFLQEYAILSITERICAIMDEAAITRSELAAKLGTTKGYITQLLDGRANMTVRKLSDVFFALGRTFDIADRPVSSLFDAPETSVRALPFPALSEEDSVADESAAYEPFTTFRLVTVAA